MARSALTWINEKTAPVQIEVAGMMYPIGKHDYPHDEESEAQTLGGILSAGDRAKGNDVLRQLPYLRYDDFFIYRHGLIFQAMLRIFERGDEVDVTTVSLELRRHKAKANKTVLDLVGGEMYLRQLANTVAVNPDSYARNVVRDSLSRGLIVSGNVIIGIGYNGALEIEQKALDANQAMRDTMIRIHSMAEQNTEPLAAGMISLGEQVRQESEDEAFEPGVTTGFGPLNEILLGWGKRRLYTTAGPTNVGKTAFLLCTALAALRDDKRVAWFSLEMERQEVLERIACIWASVDGNRLRKRRLEPDESSRFYKAVEEIASLQAANQFMLICMTRPTMRKIRTKLDELMFIPGFDLMVLDYAGWNMIAAEDQTDTVTHVGNIFTDLKDITKDYDIPLVTGCQINRDYAKRKDKRPLLSDLADSSLVEKNSDAVIFLHRDVLFDEVPDFPDRAEAIVAKNRSGPGGITRTVYLKYEAEFTRFSDWFDKPIDLSWADRHDRH